jgi:hypothetical protein
MRLMVLLALTPWIAARVLAAGPASAPDLSADQIVEKNVAARGGMEAWRKVQTMVWLGHIQSEHAPVPSMAFVLEQKRPNKTRFEINAMGQKTLRVFDGAQGWKLHPNRDGGPDVKPYTFQEVKFAQAAQSVDGPLIDYQAKGTAVSLEGVDEIEGRKAYRLQLRLASGEIDHMWVDAQTFLDVRYDRPSVNSAGASTTVSVFYRGYQTIDGLQVPSVIETGAGPGLVRDKMQIEKVMLNAPLEDRTFTRPGGHTRRSGIAMQARSVPPAMPSPDPGSGPK